MPKKSGTVDGLGGQEKKFKCFDEEIIRGGDPQSKSGYHRIWR